MLFSAECALLITIVANLFHSLERSDPLHNYCKSAKEANNVVYYTYCSLSVIYNLFSKKDPFSRAFWITQVGSIKYLKFPDRWCWNIIIYFWIKMLIKELKSIFKAQVNWKTRLISAKSISEEVITHSKKDHLCLSQ